MVQTCTQIYKNVETKRGTVTNCKEKGRTDVKELAAADNGLLAVVVLDDKTRVLRARHGVTTYE